MSEQGHEVEAVFLAALDRATPEERAAYVEQACAGRPDLLERVRELLASHDESRGPLDAAPPGMAGTVDGPGVAEGPGTVVGPYKLLQQLGEGGMGTVFMAEQTQPVRRMVALKVIKPGMDSRQVIARFEAERQALALMDHPSIAKVLDAGTTNSGRPYFVMELIKGVPITRYCDEHRLTPRQRLELFVPACQAVQHAHQKGIIHRDLKPSNVLVALYDGKPVPKVIDFGVAKAAGARLTDRTLFTEFGAVVGTLEYMAPEQAELNQLDIDTRSDIYSLGVLLYELLTGTTPLERQRLSVGALLEALRIIREEEPPKPSTRLSTAQALPTIAANRGLEPRKLSGVVRGELDWVVMKCLSKDRNRRYETANGLAQDLEHFLQNEPVSAGPPSVWYQLRKFAQRRKRALATVGLLGVMLLAGVGGVAGSLAYAARDRSARIAVAEGKTTAALDEADGLQRKNQWPEALEAAKRAQGLLPQDGSEQLRERVRETLKDINMVLTLADIRLPNAKDGVQGDGDPEVANRAYGEAFRAYGIDVEALEPAEAARLIRDRAIHLELILAVDQWAVQVPDAARMKRLVAAAQAADSDDWRNQIRDAWVRDDMDALGKLAVSPRIRELPMQSLSLLGYVLEGRGRKEALHVFRTAVQAYPDDGALYGQLGWTLDHTAGKDREALIDVVRFYTVQRALRPRNVVVTFMLGDKLAELGKIDEAVSVYEQAFAMSKEKLGPDHPDTLRSINKLGMAYHASGRLTEALPLFEQALAKRKEKLSPDHPHTLVSMNNLAWAYHEAGKFDRAEPLLREILEHRRKQKDADAATAQVLAPLGLVLMKQQKDADAEPVLRECLTLRTRLTPDDWLTFNTQSMLGGTLLGQKKYAEAEPLLIQGYEGMKQREAMIPDPGKVRLTEALERLVALYEATGQKDKAAAWRKKLDERKQLPMKPSPRALAAENNFRNPSNRWGDFSPHSAL
jgi:serine/threonine protein kinase